MIWKSQTSIKEQVITKDNVSGFNTVVHSLSEFGSIGTDITELKLNSTGSARKPKGFAQFLKISCQEKSGYKVCSLVIFVLVQTSNVLKTK